MSQHVLTELDDRVLRVELARPEKKNALTPEMYQALSEALAGNAPAGRTSSTSG